MIGVCIEGMVPAACKARPVTATGGRATALGPADESTPLPPPVCVVHSRACASPLRSAAPSRLALPPSPQPPAGDLLASRPQGRTPQPDSRAPDRGRPRPWSQAPRLPIGALIATVVGGSRPEGAAILSRLSCGFPVERVADGAGDGNRTRTICLGSLWRCSAATC